MKITNPRRLLREDTRVDRKPSEKDRLRDEVNKMNGLIEWQGEEIRGLKDTAFAMAAEKNHEIASLNDIIRLNNEVRREQVEVIRRQAGTIEEQGKRLAQIRLAILPISIKGGVL
jgi:hypothetical protein